MTDRPEHIVPLTSVPTEMEAGIIVAALDEHGVKASMSGVYTAGFRAEAPGQVQILVAQRDLERGQEVLKLAEQERQDIDWSQVDVGEPE